MKPFVAKAYEAAACPFYFNSVPAFMVVYDATRGKVCDTGCAWYANGRCASYRKLIAEAPAAVRTFPTETVREEATRRSLSINEVRRQRNSRGGA